MTNLLETFTSTGSKFFAHQEVMTKLRNGRGQPITSHVMITDVCNHKCAFCSVQARVGDSLAFDDVMKYLVTLCNYGLKAVILSGGGNPILYKCKVTGKNFNDMVDAIYDLGLEIGLITNGMQLRQYNWVKSSYHDDYTIRESWWTVQPETLDKLTWVRISMAGLDHYEREVYVPDIDPSKTALGFSYVAHDLYREPADPYHGKVSRPLDLLSGDKCRAADWKFEDRLEELTGQLIHYARTYRPRYMRLLPNCLEPSLIPKRCEQLECVTYEINRAVGNNVAFVQQKPPQAPHACYLGFLHPVLTPSGYVMPCDSHCLNESADHKLGGEPWRICHMSEIAKLYENPVRSLIADPSKTCPGCVFTHSNEILEEVVNGGQTPLPMVVPEHVNFV